jgi:hypothetical protein
MTSTFIAEIFAILTLLFSFTGAVIAATVLWVKKYIDKHDLFISTLLVMTLESMAIVFYVVMILVRYGVILKC